MAAALTASPVAFMLWANARGARQAARRGDLDTVQACLDNLHDIQRHARAPRLRDAARAAEAAILRQVRS